MPRQRRGAAAPARHAPARPTVAPKQPNVTPQQPSRSTSTAAYPPANVNQSGQPTQAGKSPGLFGQMASTAAYVTIHFLIPKIKNPPYLFRQSTPLIFI